MIDIHEWKLTVWNMWNAKQYILPEQLVNWTNFRVVGYLFNCKTETVIALTTLIVKESSECSSEPITTIFMSVYDNSWTDHDFVLNLFFSKCKFQCLSVLFQLLDKQENRLKLFPIYIERLKRFLLIKYFDKLFASVVTNIYW